MDAQVTTANREERVLALLHLLGPEAMERVCERLESPLAANLKNRLRNYTDANLPPIRRQTAIIEEFERFFRFAVAAAPPQLKLHTEDDDASEPAAPVLAPLSGDPLIDLEKMNPQQLAAAMNAEQPRTVALMMKVLTSRRVADLLGLMSNSHRAAVVREMSLEPRAPEIVLRRIAATIVERAQQLDPEPPRADDPITRMIEVLRATEKPRRKEILKTLEEQDPEKASLVNQGLYQFEDLMTLDDQQVQKVLSRVDSSTLSTALFGADARISEKVMNNLSKRARTTLQEELSFQRNVPASQLRSARDVVVRAISEADQESE